MSKKDFGAMYDRANKKPVTKKKRGRGRPKVRNAAEQHKTTIHLNQEQVLILDEARLELRKKHGATVTRSAFIRGLIDASKQLTAFPVERETEAGKVTEVKFEKLK